MDKGICLLCSVEHEVAGSHMAFQADWTQERTHTVTLVETNNRAEGQWNYIFVCTFNCNC